MNTVPAAPTDLHMPRLTVTKVLGQTAVFCTVIALILWKWVPSIGQYGFLSSFVHSQAIGICTASMAMGSSKWLNHKGVSSTLLRALVLCLVTILGLYIGMRIAAALLGIPPAAGNYLVQDQTVIATAVTALLASFAINWHFSNEHKLMTLELAASEHARRAERAKHAMLQAQLEPHMLFNTLANLRALISTDTDRALDMLDRLDSFLRVSLSSSQSLTQSLASEFAVLEDYLALIQVRFGDRLHYALDLPFECRDISVPSLLLQPLVENAIKHGIEPQIEGGTVIVSARPSDNVILLEVKDTGVGFKQGATTAHAMQKPTDGGLGLDNLRERLQARYAGDATLRIESLGENGTGGTVAQISLPIVSTKDTTP